MIKWEVKEAAIVALEYRGRVDPDHLIEAARDPAHPCHGDFTWDVDQAASERWRDQARKLIRRCRFEVLIETENVTTSVVRYVSSQDSETFSSLPKMKGVRQTADVFATELAALYGLACRVYGIAVAKEAVIGTPAVITLKGVRDTLAGLQCELD